MNRTFPNWVATFIINELRGVLNKRKMKIVDFAKIMPPHILGGLCYLYYISNSPKKKLKELVEEILNERCNKT